MTHQATQVIIRPCWLVMTLATGDRGEGDLLDDEEFDDFAAAIQHAAKLADQYGVGITYGSSGDR